MKPVERKTTDAVCAGCSCLCDDISLHIRDDELVAVENACEQGRSWFAPLQPSEGPGCLIRGQAASIDEAFEHVVELLRNSKSPLISGLSEVSTESQQLATGIADSIGAAIDVSFSPNHNGSMLAMQQVGKSTATFGEIRDRADLVVVWRANPAVDAPRLIERLHLHRCGSLFADPTSQRKVVVVDSIESETAAEFPNHRLALKPGADLDALRLLRALATGVEIETASVEQRTGVANEQWKALFEQMKAANYVAFLYGAGLAAGEVSHPTFEALFEFARDLHQHTRAVCLPAYNSRNAISARQVLAWQTGYPMAVDLRQGHPHYAPGESDAATIVRRREADVIVGLLDRPRFAEPVAERPPVIWFTDQPFDDTATEVEVAIRVARPGLTAVETFYRSDGVPLTTGGVWESPEVALPELLGALTSRLTAQPAEL